MAVTEAFVMSAVTISSSEISIVSGTTSLQANTTAGAYQLFVDPVTNMAKADEFKIQLYEKVKSSGTKRVFASWSLLGAQATNFVTPVFMLLNGWDMTLIKVAGTDRAFDASIRKA